MINKIGVGLKMCNVEKLNGSLGRVKPSAVGWNCQSDFTLDNCGIERLKKRVSTMLYTMLYIEFERVE